MIVSTSCHDRAMNSTDSPLVTIITLLIGLILGLAIGYILWRRGASNGGASSTELTEQLNAARAERDLYKSERDNAMADTKLAGELEAMKAAMEKLQKEAGDADRRRIFAQRCIGRCHYIVIAYIVNTHAYLFCSYHCSSHLYCYNNYVSIMFG